MKAIKIIIFCGILFFLYQAFLIINPVYYKGESPNFKDGTFFNNFEIPKFPTRPAFSFFAWQWERWKADVFWKEADVSAVIYANYTKQERDASASAIWIGHSSFLLQIENINILTDPIWSERASPLSFIGPKRYTRPAIKMEDLPKIDYILISHSHYDHLDLPTLKKLHKQFKPMIIAGLGVCFYINKVKNAGVNCRELDWGNSVNHNPNFKIFFEKANHYSKRTLFDTNRNLWGSFVIKTKNRTVFHSGDTAFGTHFEMIGKQYGPFDLSLIAIGAYEPRSFMIRAHINPEEAVKAHIALRSKKSIGMHLKTFQLTDESFNAPEQDLEKAKRFKALNFHTPNLGQKVLF